MAKKPVKAAVAPKRAITKVAKVVKAAKGAAVKTSARHPRARVTDLFKGKAALAKTLAAAVARADEDTDQLEARLKTASNAQLLRLQKTVALVKEKWGNREKLIAAIGTAEQKSKDKDYLTRLDRYSLPQLVDLARTSERRART
jgi:enoyl-[acyl-carrier-protein] reductase (NADH)